VSIGLCAAGGSERPEEALQRADAALYQAKKSGRNRLVTSS
jgi:PleD family two-component response regulator